MEVKRIPPTELYHHGIKGQEWGERNGPPYPLAPATSAAVKKSAVKKKKNFFERRRDKKKMKKLRDVKEQKKAEKEERERIINSGNANEIDKIKHKLTDEEYARALSRIDFNKTLSEYKAATNRAKLEDISNKVSTVAKVVGNVSNAAEAGIKVYEGLQRAGIIEKKTSEMDKLRNEKTRLELVSEISNLTNAITDNKSRNQKEIAELKRKTELERANYDYEKSQKDRNDLKKGDDDFKKLEKESKEWEYKAKIAKNQRTFNNGGMSDKEANKQQSNSKKDKTKSAFDGQNVNDAVDKAKRKKLDNKQDVNIAKTFVDAGLVPEVKKGLKGNKRVAVQAQLVREVYGDEHSGPFDQSEFKEWLKKKGYDAKDIQYLTGGSSIKHGDNMYSNVRRLRDDELEHHGVKGQQWGIRRFQNEDGSLTEAGKIRYRGTKGQIQKKIDKDYVQRHDKMSEQDSAEITLRKEARKTASNFGGSVAVAGSGIWSTGATAAITALGILSPLTLAAPATIAAAGIGSAIYNKHKLDKIAELHDEYGIPDAQRRRVV